MLEFFQNVSRNFSKSCAKVRLFFKVISRNDNFWKKIVGANKRRPLRRKLPVQNHTLLKTSNGETVYPVYSLRSRRLEVVGERENGRARGRHSPSRAPVFPCAHHFQAPATQATQFKTQDAENHILFSGSAAHIRLDQIRECQ